MPAALLAAILSVVAAPGAGEGDQAMQAPNLARLAETTPGASRAVAWTRQAGEVEVPSLADGDRKAPAPLPAEAVAFGIGWAIPHVADRAAAFIAGEPAAEGALTLEAFDGRRWVAVKAEAATGRRSIRWRFDPTACRQMRVAFRGRPPDVTELEVRAYVPARRGGRITWPEALVTRKLEADLLARKEEPSFESLSLHGLSMPVWAMMGIKDWPHEQAVSWDGRILVPLFHVSCRLAGKGFADVRDTVRRRLIDGWLPGVITEGQFGNVRVTQTCFVTFTDDAGKESGLFVRYDLRNVSATTGRSTLRVQLDWLDKRTVADFRDRMLVKGKAVYLVCSGPCRAGKVPNSIECGVDLEPGKTASVAFAAPVNYDGGADRPISAHLPGTSYAKALACLRAYWGKLLAPAMKLDLPEQRLNDLYRAVVAQLFINADRDVMPYGAKPSAYEGRLYGVEEGFAMTALALSGFYADAQRYLDGTYLTKRFLRKVPKFRGYGDRHQQYRNGLQPMYAVGAYRLSRDRKWIEQHLALLIECAEWTIANRRKTMQAEGGKRPLHWGLLPKWSYGGDLASRQCYPLYANIACWRGLVETAWLLGELGRKEAADRYAAEAAEYHRTILGVIDKIYRADATPPFLPPHVYARTPEGREYYQLFAGCILDLLPFEFADKRADYLGRFLETDNRTFCMLPRFRRDAGPGGLDAIYGLGYMLTKLHQDRIQEFLLGFYAFCAFNLEHGCFSSRETNLIYASDTHLRSRFPVPDVSDPLPCSSAVALLMLRHMLLTEDNAGAARYTGKLLLLPGAPRRWFRQGQTIEVAGAPTHFGKVSFRVASRAEEGVIEAEVTAPGRNPCQALRLRLRHPVRKRFRKVLVNGRAHRQIDPKAETIEIHAPRGKYRIEAHY